VSGNSTFSIIFMDGGELTSQNDENENGGALVLNRL
jgi:hypothetical protein